MDAALRNAIAQQKSAARDALAGFIRERQWDYWVTVTFAKPERYAGTSIEKVAHSLDLHRESIWPLKRAIIAAELHQLGNYHCHALIAGAVDSWQSDEAVPRFIERSIKRWGWNRVESIKRPEQVSLYISKYLCKDSRSEWMIYGDDWR